MSISIPILLYHSIAEDASNQFRKWSLPPRDFAAQIGYLKKNKYTPMTVTRLVRAISSPNISLPDRPIVLSFDDGFEDFYSQAFPILESYSFPATLYVVTGFVGGSSKWLSSQGEGDRPMLTWQQIEQLENAGIEIGAHSQTHPQLDTLSPQAAWEQIMGSKLVLEQRLGKRVTSFAYPHGYYGPLVRNLVRQARYLSACGVKHAMSSLEDDRFALARIIVSSGISLTELRNLLTGKGLSQAPGGERLQTKAWRLFRRSLVLWRSHSSITSIR